MESSAYCHAVAGLTVARARNLKIYCLLCVWLPS